MAPPDDGTRPEQNSVDWRVYRGSGEQHGDISRVPEPPRWRRFAGQSTTTAPDSSALPVSRNPGLVERARLYRPDPQTVEMVNAALYLRRPLLVTGKPGTGKSTLAYSVAWELGLGPVLHWPITSRSTLAEALYRYDAIGRLQDTNLQRAEQLNVVAADIGRYVQLGPLGTALVPSPRPRALLIDEFDKSDVDLPNDLLHVFEEGYFEITELARLPKDQATVEVRCADPDTRVSVEHGHVACAEFPLVIITSNFEREFPPAFLRRCLRLNIPEPDSAKIAAIVADQLGPEALAASSELIDRFLVRRDGGDLAIDQLLNAIFLVMADPERLRDPGNRTVSAMFQPLNVRDHAT